MSDNVLLAFFLGLFIGGLIGTLAVAVVASGSAQRLARLFPRVDLGPKLYGLKSSAETSVVRTDDVEPGPERAETRGSPATPD